jgi:hypothetical protein
MITLSMNVLNAIGIIVVVLVMIINYFVWSYIKEKRRIVIDSPYLSAVLLFVNYVLSFFIVFVLIGVFNRTLAS